MLSRPARWDQLDLGYTDPQGAPALRHEICNLYQTVSWEEVIVAAPQELINMAFQAMLRPGDHVVSVFPGYQSLYEIARHIGCDVSFWEPEEHKDGSFVFKVYSVQNLCLATGPHIRVTRSGVFSTFTIDIVAWQGVGASCITRTSHIQSLRTLISATWDGCTAVVSCIEWREQPAALT